MSRIPVWLYESRDHHGLRTQRWGSVKKLGVCLMSLGTTSRPKAKKNWMLTLGRLNLSWGPEGGVSEGHAQALPHYSWSRIWFRGWWAFAVAWEAS